VVLKAGVWYVVASSPTASPHVRVSRIATCRPLDVRARPDGFDLATYWAESSSAYERGEPLVEVVIRIAPNASIRLAVFVGRWAVDRAEHLDVDDRMAGSTCASRLNWPEDVHGQLLAVGSSLEVLEPPEVRARVQATVARRSPLRDSPTPAVPRLPIRRPRRPQHRRARTQATRDDLNHRESERPPASPSSRWSLDVRYSIVLRLFFSCHRCGPPSGQVAGSAAARHPAGGSTRRR
jgi:hypothetical protein